MKWLWEASDTELEGPSAWLNRPRRTPKSATGGTHSSRVTSTEFVPEQTTQAPEPSNQPEVFQSNSPEVTYVNLRPDQEKVANGTPSPQFTKPKLSDRWARRVRLARGGQQEDQTRPAARIREPPSSTLYFHQPKPRKVFHPVFSLLFPSN